MLLHGFWVISTNETELVCQIAMLQLLFYWTIKITHMVADIKYNLIANWIQKKVNGVSLMDYFPESIVFLNGSQGKSCWVYSSFGKNVKEDPWIQISIFQEKSDPFIYQSVQFWAKFWAKSPDFSNIFLNLSQFWLKFGELLKNRPILIPNFAFYKEYSYTKRLILLPMLVAHPHRVFGTEYPPINQPCMVDRGGFRGGCPRHTPPLILAESGVHPLIFAETAPDCVLAPRRHRFSS